MPGSDVLIVPHAIDWTNRVKPKSILDFGCGFGTYGFLWRQYYDTAEPKYNDKQPTKDTHWNFDLRIDAVEAFQPYISKIHYTIYDNVYNMEGKEFLLNNTNTYDLIYIGDCLEHFSKGDAIWVINQCADRCKHILISTPKGYVQQDASYGNKYEEHKSGWEVEDFKRLNYIDHKLIDKRYLLVLLNGIYE